MRSRYRAPRILGTLVGLALVVAFAAYARTGDAFGRVWLPLAGMLAGARIDAESGRLGWTGSLRAVKLAWRSPELSFYLEDVAVDVAPLSLLPGRTLHVQSLRVRGGGIRIGGARDAERAPAQASEANGHPPSVPRIDRARVERVAIHIATDGAAGWRLGPLHLEVDDLGAPHPGHLALEGPFVAGGTDAAGEGTLRVQIALAGPEAEQREFAADVRLETTGAAPPSAAAPLRLSARASGHANGLRALRVSSLALELARDDTPLASFALSGAVDGRKVALAGSFSSLAPDVLADVAGFARAAPLLGAGSDLSGDFDLVAERNPGGGVRGAAKLLLRDLTLAAARPPGPAELLVRAAVDWDEGLLTLAHGSATSVGVDGATLGSLEAQGRLDLGAGSETHGEIELRELVLAPWLAAYGAPLGDAGPLITSGKLVYEEPSDGNASLEGELRVGLPGAPAGESARAGPVVYEIRPSLSFGKAAVGGTIELVGRDADGGSEGRAVVDLVLDTSQEPAALSVQAAVDSLDATPIRRLLVRGTEGAEDSYAEAPPEAVNESASGAAPDDATAFSDAPLAIAIDGTFEALRLGDLLAREGSIAFDRSPGRLEISLAPTRLAGGSAQFSFERRSDGGRTSLALSVRADSLRLATLFSALAIDPDGRVGGALTLATDLTAEARTGSALLEDANGRISFEVDEGKLESLHFQDVIAKETALPEFRLIRFERASGNYPVRDGTVAIAGLRIDGPIVHLAVAGEVRADGFDLRINPRVGPDLARRLPTHLARSLAATAGPALALPLVVDVGGRYGAIEVRTRPALPSLLGTLFDGVTGLAGAALEWRRREAGLPQAPDSEDAIPSAPRAPPS